MYGPDFIGEILKLLHQHPAVAVPVVAARLRQKQDEFVRKRQESSKEYKAEAEDCIERAHEHRGYYCRLEDEQAMNEQLAIGVLEQLPRGGATTLCLKRSEHAHVDALAVVRVELARRCKSAAEVDCCMALFHDMLRGVFGFSITAEDTVPYSELLEAAEAEDFAQEQAERDRIEREAEEREKQKKSERYAKLKDSRETAAPRDDDNEGGQGKKLLSLVFVPTIREIRDFIARCNALIEKVSTCVRRRRNAD
eukprot:SAG31_NODE_202_length_20512_cov_62.659237_3_plen_252_part_00